MPVVRAVLSLAIPTIISQLVTVCYNMADTFFIAHTGNPHQVAAAHICAPMFFLLTAIANLFGIGGASLISRKIGEKDFMQASEAAAFSIWAGITASLIYGISVYAAGAVILPMCGANSDSFIFCRKYSFWIIAAGSVPTVMNPLLAHLVRSEGHAKEAGFGMVMGTIINIILDPLFISALDMQIAGAGLATMLANLSACIYFIIFISKQKKSIISISAAGLPPKNSLAREIILVGLPSALMSIMTSISNITLNRLLASYSNEAVAGVGIAKKIDYLAFGIATGMAQGVIPLIAYNYASKNYVRMKRAIKTAFIFSISTAFLGAFALYSFASPMVRAFINDPKTVEYGEIFQKIICIGGPCISVTLISITIFQAAGRKIRPLFISMLRKGGLDIPFMIAMNHIGGVKGIIWATPIADFGAMIIALCFLIPFLKNLKDTEIFQKA